MQIKSLEESGLRDLVLRAREAGEKAYCPYSHFHVGAALVCADGAVYAGCNIENVSYSPTVCAERTAIFKAVSEGRREFRAIAVVGRFEGESDPRLFSVPCGVCRQVMSEFCDPDGFHVACANDEGTVKIFTLRELLPEGFDPYSSRPR